MQPYSIWIEAEQWAPGHWTPADENSDVIITFEDGSRWVATFFSYTNINTLVEKNRRTGEYMSGKYFWAGDMILVDEVSRARVEEVVRYLLETREFKQIFTGLPPAIDEGDPTTPSG
ncbi:MAG TPA: hypothetical protein VF276_13275 [Chloroflexia bacterium]